jgi:hypothetical protein
VGSLDALCRVRVHCPLVVTGLGLIWIVSPFITINKDVKTRNLHEPSTETQGKSRKWTYNGAFRISSVCQRRGKEEERSGVSSRETALKSQPIRDGSEPSKRALEWLRTRIKGWTSETVLRLFQVSYISDHYNLTENGSAKD